MEETTQQPTPAGESSKKERNGIWAVVAYLLFFVPLLVDAKNDPFVKYHIKQGLGLFILGIGVSVVNMFMPHLFWFVELGLSLGMLVLFVLGVMNALGGKKEPLPIIGQMSEKINI